MGMGKKKLRLLVLAGLLGAGMVVVPFQVTADVGLGTNKYATSTSDSEGTDTSKTYNGTTSSSSGNGFENGHNVVGTNNRVDDSTAVVQIKDSGGKVTYTTAGLGAGKSINIFGDGNTVAGEHANAFGGGVTVKGQRSNAVGEMNVVVSSTSANTGGFSNAYGTYVAVYGTHSNAFGSGTSASYQNLYGDYSLLLGDNSKIGTSNTDSGKANYAIGVGANASVAAGANQAIAIGSGTSSGSGATASSVKAIAIGTGAAATGESAIAEGDEASTSSAKDVAIGKGATAKGGSGGISTAVGGADVYVVGKLNDAGTAFKSTSYTAVSAGDSDASEKTRIESLGSGNTTASGRNSTALGSAAVAASSCSTAAGHLATVASDAANGSALGGHSYVTAEGAVALGYESIANEKNTVSVGNAEKTRKITNVTKGTAKTDAATVEQTSSVKAGTNIDVTTSNDPTNGSTIYTVSAKSDGTITSANVGLVTGGTVFSHIYADTSANQIHLGNGATSSGGRSVAIGGKTRWRYEDGKDQYTQGTDEDTYATEAAGSYATAIGSGAYVSNAGNCGTALGHFSTVLNQKGTAIGGHTFVNADYGTALGLEAKVLKNATNSVALGYDSQTSESNVVSVGGGSNVKTRKITNVTKGTNTTDAANVGQLTKVAVASNNALKLDSSAKDTTTGSTTYTLSVTTNGQVVDGNTGILTGDTVYDYLHPANGIVLGTNWSNADKTVRIESGKSQNVFGSGNSFTDAEGVTDVGSRNVFGDNNKVAGKDANAFGGGMTVNGAKSNAIGETSQAIGTYTNAYGTDVKVNGNYSNAFGTTLNVYGDADILLGYNSSIGASSSNVANAVGVGNGVKVTGASAIAMGYQASASGKGSVAIGAGSTATEANVVSVGGGSGDSATRRIVNVKTGINNNDAVNVAQLPTVAVDDSNSNLTLDSTKDNSTGSTKYTLKLATNGAVTESNTGIVTGGTVYTALQGYADTGLSNITDTGKNVIKNQAQEAVKVAGTGYATVTPSTAGDTITYTIDVQGDGKVESGDTKLVTGGTVYNAINTLKTDTETSLGNKANVDASNVTGDNVGKWQTVLGTGKVESNNTGLVTGGAVNRAIADEATARKAADAELTNKIGTVADNTSYLDKDASVGDNLGKLDTQVKTNTDAIAKEVTDRTKAVSDEETARKAADTELTNKIGTVADNTNYLDKDASVGDNLGKLDTQVKTNTDAIAKEVTDRTKAVSDEETARKAADTELTNKIGSVADNMNYLDKDASVGDNLGKLDTQAKTNADDISKEVEDRTVAVSNEATARAEADTSLGNRIDTNVTNIASNKTAIDTINENNKATDGQYVTAANTVGKNLDALDAAIKNNDLNVTSVKQEAQQNVLDAKKDIIAKVYSGLQLEKDTNVLQFMRAKVNESTGEITSNPDDVTTVIINKDSANKVQIDGDGIRIGQNSGQVDAEGFYAGGHTYSEAASALSADGSIKGAGGKFAVDTTGHVSAQGMDAGGQKITSVAAGEADTDAVNVSQLKNGTNVDVDKWASVLGTGSVTGGETNLVNGGTVYDALAKLRDSNGNYLVEKVGGDKTISIGYYDDSNNINVRSQKGVERTIRGVATDPSDGTSAANVAFVDNQIDGLHHRLNRDINRAAAGVSALAALHPLDYDPADRLNFAVGYGHYKDANAAAVGAFYYANPNVMFSVGASMGNGNSAVNAGVTFKVGPGSSYAGVSKVQLAQDNAALKQEVARLQQHDDATSKQLAELQKQVAAMAKALGLANPDAAAGETAEVTLTDDVSKSVVA